MNVNLRFFHSLSSQALLLLLGVLAQAGCDAAQPKSGAGAAPAELQLKEFKMWMTVGERRFAITLADNETARAFGALLPLSLSMADLNSNEKHADLPSALPMNASRPGTIRNGDLMLYGSKTFVLFYRKFDSSYSYTRIGRVDDPVTLEQALGQRAVQITFSRD